MAELVTGSRRWFVWLVLGLAAAGLVVYVLYSILQAAQTTKSIRDTQQTVKACTTPGQPCYERSQRQLAATVSGLTTANRRSAAAAAACAASLPRPSYAAVYRCVIRTLASDQHR